jgi:hypothetical protein
MDNAVANGRGKSDNLPGLTAICSISDPVELVSRGVIELPRNCNGLFAACGRRRRKTRRSKPARDRLELVMYG